MSGQLLQFNDIQISRYSVTTVCNDVIFQVITSPVASSNLEHHDMNLTYDDLNDLLQKQFGLADDGAEPVANAAQQFRNHRTALHGFLATVGKTTDARVGAELTTRFDESLRKYLDLLKVADSTKRDRRSYLKRYRDIYTAQRDETAAKSRQKTTTLSEMLREAIAEKGLAPKTLARSVGVSTSAVQRYLAGATPNRRGIPGLRRLELALGLERDSLTSLVKQTDDLAEMGIRPDNEYRKRQAGRIADTYYLPLSAIGDALEHEWRQFLTYKTAVTPRFERTAKGIWRCIPATTTPIDVPLAKVGNAVCPTAVIALERIRGFLGYLSRPVENGGQGIPAESAQTLAWLAVPWAVSAYLEFLTQRSDGLVHGGQQGFARFVCSLVREKTGYLRQRPEIRNALPADIRPESIHDWERSCDDAYKTAKQWVQHAKDMSRHPDAPIASLLALESPLRPVIAAVARIERLAAEAPSGSVSQARHKRDALLIAFVISNPLRLRTLQSLTWSSDNTGSVYRTPGGWRVRLSRSMLKNGNSKAGTKYDVAVAPWVGDMLDEYAEEFRGTLLGDSESPYLFVNNRDGRPWAQMSQHVFRLTSRHVPETQGFRLHAFRHLVATDLLKRNPNAFITAAVLLNDALETVMRSYAHLQRDDSFATHHQHLVTLRIKCEK